MDSTIPYHTIPCRWDVSDVVGASRLPLLPLVRSCVCVSCGCRLNAMQALAWRVLLLGSAAKCRLGGAAARRIHNHVITRTFTPSAAWIAGWSVSSVQHESSEPCDAHIQPRCTRAVPLMHASSVWCRSRLCFCRCAVRSRLPSQKSVAKSQL